MRHHRLAVAALVLGLWLAVDAAAAAAQEWSPPSRQMPSMQQASDGSFTSRWLIPDPNRSGEIRSSASSGFVRFSAGPRPVAAWSDRNGDGRSDMLQLYRGTAMAYQLVDADYDGTADVLRIYDGNGQLQREVRL
jgi:hypothetical protein